MRLSLITRMSTTVPASEKKSKSSLSPHPALKLLAKTVLASLSRSSSSLSAPTGLPLGPLSLR